jgi:hypothetical protein
MTTTPDPDRLRERGEAFVVLLNSGVQLPPADPAIIRRMAEYLDAIDVQQHTTKGMGLGAVAGGLGIDVGSFDSFDYFNAGMRCHLLRALNHGALKEQFVDPSSRARLFDAAATFPFSGDDVKEAFASMHLAEHPEEDTLEVSAALQERGGTPGHPSFEARFLAWLAREQQP